MKDKEIRVTYYSKLDDGKRPSYSVIARDSNGIEYRFNRCRLNEVLPQNYRPKKSADPNYEQMIVDTVCGNSPMFFDCAKGAIHTFLKVKK